ncbi:MAG: bifunctional 2-polyprenyl-6-hydroxyphenol methylase/3-demethylubiquinol 3-O-methyltransferase UbiG [Rhodospirillaceae bacterium]|jgi:2-polyprenyl-6-hydroxyphenyl methylase/3-demethylubiquinone-9 3-methyltransferase
MASTIQPKEATNARPAQGTASPEELAHFSAMAEEWWDPHGKFRPLHKLNPTRLRFIRDQLIGHFERNPETDQPLKGLTLLDIGCGGGLLAEPMCRLGASVTGIDASEKTVGIASHHAAQSGLDIHYRCTVPEELAQGGETFDIVLNMEVVEHVADVGLFLAACKKLIKPNGAMVLSTINRTVKSLALAKIGAEYILRWLPAGTHDWRKFIRPSEITKELQNTGLEITALEGMSYNPLTDKWSLSRDLDVNYLAVAVHQ